jgi:hypothetical protein
MKTRRRITQRKNRHVLLAEVKQKTQSKVLRGHATTVAIGIGVTVALLVGVHFASQGVLNHAFYRNEDFALKTIDVQVTGNVSRSEILEWAAVEPGMNLMHLNLVDVRKRLARMPYIASVSVQRQLPATLRIIVEERQPVARLVPFSASGNQLAQSVYYIDDKGFVMKPKPGERIKPLPTIKGVAHEYIREGERTDRAELLSALNLLRAAEYSALKSELDLTELEVQARGYLILRTRDQGRIVFRTDYLQEQMQRLRVVLEYAREKQLFVRTVDLTPERNVPVTFF